MEFEEEVVAAPEEKVVVDASGNIVSSDSNNVSFSIAPSHGIVFNTSGSSVPVPNFTASPNSPNKISPCTAPTASSSSKQSAEYSQRTFSSASHELKLESPASSSTSLAFPPSVTQSFSNPSTSLPSSRPAVDSSASDRPSKAPFEMNEFDCGICYSLLCEPVTISCGHTFCRVCLVTALERSRKKCPECRAPCHIAAETQAPNVLITNLIERHFPAEYRRRLQEISEEKKKWDFKTPLFLSTIPLFPNQPLSLHLFEPRYKLMIKRVLSGNKRFGVLASSNVKRGDVGTVFEVLESEFLADGRALLECIGRGRFCVLDSWVEDGTQGLNYCTFSEFDDSSTPEEDQESLAAMEAVEENPSQESVSAPTPVPAPNQVSVPVSRMRTADELCAAARSLVRELVTMAPRMAQLERHYGPMPGPAGHVGISSLIPQPDSQLSDEINVSMSAADASKLSFWLVSFIPMDPQTKVHMLSVTSTIVRLKAAVKSLNALVVDLRLVGPAAQHMTSSDLE